MSWDAWITLGVMGLVCGLLVGSRIGPDIILCGGLTLLVTCGVLTPEKAVAGLANEGLVTVGLLFIVAIGLRETGGMSRAVQHWLGRPHSIMRAQARLILPVVALSAFLNNTPLVAMLLPVVDDWARQCRLAVSKLMIPLSYASTLGGTCTLIGTSTNLVVSGLLSQIPHLPRLGFFDIAWVGFPCALGSVNWQVLVVIAAAFGLAEALQSSGAAAAVAGTLVGLAGDNPWLALATVYGVTMLFTNMITNNAAAVLMFPIAVATATSLHVSPMPFVMTLMMAAACAFATPIAYQTNLMVYGPGGYHFIDYLRFGGPLSLLLWAVTVIITPLVWPF